MHVRAWGVLSPGAKYIWAPLYGPLAPTHPHLLRHCMLVCMDVRVCVCMYAVCIDVVMYVCSYVCMYVV